MFTRFLALDPLFLCFFWAFEIIPKGIKLELLNPDDGSLQDPMDFFGRIRIEDVCLDMSKGIVFLVVDYQFPDEPGDDFALVRVVGRKVVQCVDHEDFGRSLTSFITNGC